MAFDKRLEAAIFNINNATEFEAFALDVFLFQYQNVAIYRSWVDGLGIQPNTVKSLNDIPFLPISFFKSHKVLASGFQTEEEFKSSATTGMIQSSHFVAKADLYQQSFLRAFKLFYGDPSQFEFYGLLPSYLERSGSSLIYMVDALIKASQSNYSGFYLKSTDKMLQNIATAGSRSRTPFLIGVTYALLELATQVKLPANTIVLETGGMKGRGKELIRAELHAVLSSGLGVQHIHSEYGMTELLSQGYSIAEGVFYSPPWMKILIREVNDPFTLVENGKTGGINVIDLANLYSCAFIETSDLGKMTNDGGFEVLGRFDNSELRGCNLLVL